MPKIETNFIVSANSKYAKGFPDSNYVWEGDVLVWEREVIDDEGKKRIVKTYRDPIEIIANFKPNSKVYGFDKEGKIEKAAVKKFGGALKGFVWLDNVSGSGEVILPFTAPHIFIATGDRLNPELTEIGTDPNEDNYYELVKEDIDGELVEIDKTRVFVKNFSGIGGAAGAAATLIAHYKFNENTAGDNAELITDGDLSSWSGDNPVGWEVNGESGSDPEISEVGTGEGHGGAGTGMCNLYTSVGASISIKQENNNLIVGRRYRVSINVDTVTAGGIYISEQQRSQWPNKNITSSGVYTWTFVAVNTSYIPLINRLSTNTDPADVTFNNFSIKLLAVEDSSGNDHDSLAQQDTSAISVAGKINTAFDFTPNDFIEIADHDDFTPALTPFSISVWAYMHDATFFRIASKGLYNTDGEWLFYTNNIDKLGFQLMDESVDNCHIGRSYSVALTSYENQWIHIVGTYDGGTLSSGIKIYLNNSRVDNIDDKLNAGSFVSVENLNHAVWIGRRGTSYADGLIDNVMFFGKELTQKDIDILYNNGLGTGFYRCNIHVIDQSGIGLDGVVIECTNPSPSQEFLQTTDGYGVMSEQLINYTSYEGIGYLPYKFVFTKAGYESLTINNVVGNLPIDWEIVMPKAVGAFERTWR